MATHRRQYQIRKTEKYIAESQKLHKSFNRVTDLLKAIDWALERKPHSFTLVSGDYYMLVTGQLSNEEFPEVRVLYLINEDELFVMLINISES